MSETAETAETPGTKRVLLGVGGGIAAYKCPELVRSLRRVGCEVRVVTTPAARAFVTPLSLSSVSGHPVRGDLLDVSEEGTIGHIELADWPDLVVVAPATANLMARARAGLADDLLTTILLATTAPVLMAPAMNSNMWRHAATRANVAALAERGVTFVGPDSGMLACGWEGPGRMMDPSEIAAEVSRRLRGAGSWAGRRVLVSAGPTRSYLDPVRFVSNASSGRMGFSMAAEAASRGASVTLVSGPVTLATPPGVERIDVETAPAMLEAMDRVLAHETIDLVAMVAAVSDFETSVRDHKIPKEELAQTIAGELSRPGVDVLATLVERYGTRTFFLGFAAQTVDADDPARVAAALLEAGRAKLKMKGCDALFANRVGVPHVGFDSRTNTGLLLLQEGERELVFDPEALLDKGELAGWILERLDAWVRG